MGTRGPTPTPTKILKLRGSRRANRNKVEPKFTEGMVEPPNWLDGDAKNEWDRVVVELQAINILQRVDMAVLATYCQAYSDVARLTEKVRRAGETLISTAGNPYLNPDFNVLSVAYTRLERSVAKLGFSPSDRARLNLPFTEPEPLDEKDQWLKNLIDSQGK